MGYRTYTTEALVCGSRDSFTSDRSYLLFTENAGMVWAAAKSVRTEGSRQRYALQDFSHIRVSLIKGKAGWRIGSVESLGNAFLRASTRQERAVIQEVVRNLRRFVVGEEPVPALFADATAALRAADIYTDTLSQLFLLRLLHTLGYVKNEPLFAPFLDVSFAEALERELPPLAHAAIDRALKVSHL